MFPRPSVMYLKITGKLHPHGFIPLFKCMPSNQNPLFKHLVRPISEVPGIRKLLDCSKPGLEDSMPELEAKVLNAYKAIAVEAELERAMAENFGLSQVTDAKQRQDLAMPQLVSLPDSQTATEIDQASGEKKRNKSKKGTKTLKEAKRSLAKLCKVVTQGNLIFV